MFWILIVIGGAGFALCVIWFINKRNRIAVIPAIACIALIIISFLTPQGKMYWTQLVATGKYSNWLVVDNSGGVTLRHWVLKDSYVGSSDKSDGWKFYDKQGNGPCYVSGDAYVMRINEPLRSFLEHYKKTYNIPEDQQAIE